MVKCDAPRRLTCAYRLAPVLIAWLIPATILAQAIVGVQVYSPRDFGYTIGDKFSHELTVRLRTTHELDAASLPETGRVNRWFEITRAESHAQQRGDLVDYRVLIEYQILNAPRILTSITTPQLDFLVTGSKHSIPIFLPEWTFSIGPVANLNEGDRLNLKPDRQPHRIPVKNRETRVLISAMLLAALLAYFAYARWLLPQLNRNQYPFFNALTELRKLQRSGSDRGTYQRGLQAFHAALNATSGKTLFARDLDEFFRQHSTFEALRTEMTALYSESSDVFFNNADVAEPEASLQALIRLCHRCRALERSA